MYLSKLEIPLSGKAGIAVLQDRQRIHEVITTVFNGSQSRNNITYRLNTQRDKVIVYVYSSVPVSGEYEGVSVLGCTDITNWLQSFTKNKTVSFDILTIPFKKVATEGKKNSSRKVLRTYEERMAWLERKAEQNGFEILGVTERQGETIRINHKDSKGGRIILNSYQYSGMLKVLDEDKFRESITAGIGPGKAYGLGMVLVK